MNEIKDKLIAHLPGPYVLDWDGYPQQPIRYRINTTREYAEIYSFIWTEAFTTVTGFQPSSEEKRVKFTVPGPNCNIFISIFPGTGTVMLQGKQSPAWADANMVQICEIVKNDKKGYLKPAICSVCLQDGDDEMVVCDRTECKSWTHNQCAGLTETSARKTTYWCKNCQGAFNLCELDPFQESNTQLHKTFNLKASSPISKNQESKYKTPRQSNNSISTTSSLSDLEFQQCSSTETSIAETSKELESKFDDLFLPEVKNTSIEVAKEAQNLPNTSKTKLEPENEDLKKSQEKPTSPEKTNNATIDISSPHMNETKTNQTCETPTLTNTKPKVSPEVYEENPPQNPTDKSEIEEKT